MIRVLVLSASMRPAGFSARLAGAATKELALSDVEATRISLKDYPMPLFEEDIEKFQGLPPMARRLADQVRGHDGLFIATPEHNSALPAALKNALDWLSRQKDGGRTPLAGKPVALAAASPDAVGGLRCLTMLRPLLEIGYGALVMTGQVTVPHAAEAFTPGGELARDEEAQRLTLLCRRLKHFSELAAREALTP